MCSIFILILLIISNLSTFLAQTCASTEYSEEDKCLNCSEAISKCLTCTNAVGVIKCLKCEEGFGLDPKENKCSPCGITYCSECERNLFTLKFECLRCMPKDTYLPLYPLFMKCANCSKDQGMTSHNITKNDNEITICTYIPSVNINSEHELKPMTLYSDQFANKTKLALNYLEVCENRGNPTYERNLSDSLIYAIYEYTEEDSYNEENGEEPILPTASEIEANYIASGGANFDLTKGPIYVGNFSSGLKSIVNQSIPFNQKEYRMVTYCVNEFKDESSDKIYKNFKNPKSYYTRYIAFKTAKILKDSELNNLTCELENCILSDNITLDKGQRFKEIKKGVVCNPSGEMSSYETISTNTDDYINVFEIPSTDQNYLWNFSPDLCSTINNITDLECIEDDAYSDSLVIEFTFCCEVPTIIPGITNAFIRLDLEYRNETYIDGNIPVYFSDSDKVLYSVFLFAAQLTEKMSNEAPPSINQLRGI
jgi:hypothetical protein